MSIRTYAVNCNDAWLNTEGDDISGSYVKYKDHQEVVAALEAKCAALAAENSRLKAGAMYFSYGSEFSFECHKTAEEAIAAAEAAIDDYRGDACDGWSEEVESICWGVIIQQATKVGERKKRKCDRVSPWIAELDGNRTALAVENASMKLFIRGCCYVFDGHLNEIYDGVIVNKKEGNAA